MMLEAWASKIPVVAKAIDGSLEIFSKHNFEGGLTYSTQDELVSTIQLTLENRNKFGQEGYEIVKEYYQWENIVNEYLIVYNNLLNS